MTVIIGGGVAGLTAGIFLAEAGEETLICERGAVAGGNLCGWEREGYTVDSCLHWLTGTLPGTDLRQLWEKVGALGGGTGVRELPWLYASAGYGELLRFYRDPACARSEMTALSPADAAGLNRFFDAVENLREIITRGGTCAQKIQRVRDFVYYAPRSLSCLSAGWQHPLLRAAFTDYIGGEYSALGLLLTYAAFTAGNADLPAGGSRQMAERMIERYRSLGGVLRTGCTVAEVLLDASGRARGVRLSDGEQIAAERVICATDPEVTFRTLLPPASMPVALARMYRDPVGYPVYSAVHLAYAAEGELPFGGTCAIPIRTLWVGGEEYTRLVLREFSHEPGYAPAGSTVVQVLCFQHAPAARGWIDARRDTPEEYNARKEALAAEVTARICDFYPSLAGKLRKLDVWTPATYHRYFGSHLGAFMSFALTGKRLPLPVPVTPRGVRGVFLAGQWYRAPGGTPMAAVSGREAARAALAYRPTA